MRIASLAVTLGLLVASSANAQPQPAPEIGAPAAAETLPVSDPALAAKLDAVTGTNPWGMCGPRAWVNAEYLLWWVTPMNTPPLIQTVPTATALNAFVGGTTLPAGSAQQVFPDSRQLQFGAFSGVRASAGVNFDQFGIDGSVFYLPQRTSGASLSSNGSPYSVAESFVRAGTGTPISLLASLPTQASGGISTSVTSRLWGADANVRLPFYNFLTDSTDVLFGFRYLNLQEKLGINFHSDLASGSGVQVNDSVQTTNHFYGGQVGFNGKINGVERGIGFDATGKLAIGDMMQQAILSGSNTIVVPGQLPSTQPGGLYTSGPNAGTFSRDKFAMLYEQNFNVTYNFNRWTQVYIGYSIIWVSSVIRPGEAINQTVNDANLRFVANPPANTASPGNFQWKANDFWTQGITFGLRLQY